MHSERLSFNAAGLTLIGCLARSACQVTVDCTPESSEETEEQTGEETGGDDIPEGERERIVFDSEAVSAFVHGSLSASEGYGYVLTAHYNLPPALDPESSPAWDGP